MQTTRRFLNKIPDMHDQLVGSLVYAGERGGSSETIELNCNWVICYPWVASNRVVASYLGISTVYAQFWPSVVVVLSETNASEDMTITSIRMPVSTADPVTLLSESSDCWYSSTPSTYVCFHADQEKTTLDGMNNDDERIACTTATTAAVWKGVSRQSLSAFLWW